VFLNLVQKLLLMFWFLDGLHVFNELEETDEENVPGAGFDSQGNCPVGTAIRVRELDWFLIETVEDLDVFGDVDILLAADVVYDITVLEHLARVIRLFLSKPRAPKDGEDAFTPFALIATNVRTPNTFATFQKRLEEQGLLHEDVTSHYRQTSPDQFYYNRSETLVLSRLTLNNKN
jgi:hypothetical protein